MQKRNALALGPATGGLINQLYACGAAAGQGRVEIIDFEADMVHAGAALGEKLCNRGLRQGRFKQFDQRLAGSDTRNASAVGICQR